MKTVKFNLKGEYGHFKCPYSNNSPTTYSIIPKTALIGVIGAVVGIEREDLKQVYEEFCNSLLYSVQINNTLIKENVGIYQYYLLNVGTNKKLSSPRTVEMVKNIDWDIYLSLKQSSSLKTKQIFENFIFNIKNNINVWKPYLGITECIAELSFTEEKEVVEKTGKFFTKTFVEKILLNDDSITSKDFKNIFSENIPVIQNNDQLNIEYKKILFSENNNYIQSEGKYYKFDTENITLI